MNQIRIVSPMLTTIELAERLNIKPATIEKARSTGLGSFPPFVRIGSKAIRYRLSDVIDWENSRLVRHGEV